MDQGPQFDVGGMVPGTRYRVLGLVGSGGMGMAYEVEHIELGKRFVLKALRQGFNGRTDLVQRLRNEWRALGRLEHPNIVSVTDAGTTNEGVAYFVMERLEGHTLAARLRAGRIRPVEAVDIVMAILNGLGAAHAIGIVHRDVKPANVFLTTGGQLKLLDFGIAKEANAEAAVTGSGLAVGTPRYMSPEQARGKRVDGRADLYSVGLLLFEMLTGRSPFEEHDEVGHAMYAHINTKPPRLRELAPHLPPELDELMAELLDKDPGLAPTALVAPG